jgi:hypothetical protein
LYNKVASMCGDDTRVMIKKGNWVLLSSFFLYNTIQ